MEPHVPIFVSANIGSASRVVLIFGETCQELGVLAHRVIGGAGGVDKGSLVSVVRALQGQRASADDDDASAPGIILANTGELLWSPAVRRALTRTGFDGVPMPSAVHAGMHYDAAEHRVPGHATARDHVRYVFETVVPAFCNAAARFDLLGVGDGVNAVLEHFDWGVTWGRLRARINSFAIVGGFFSASDLQCESFQMFLREVCDLAFLFYDCFTTTSPKTPMFVPSQCWIQLGSAYTILLLILPRHPQKARAWVLSPEPLNTALAGADGNPNAPSITNFGCPTFSGGTADFVECLLVRSQPAVLAWLQEVALDGAAYKNPIIITLYEDTVPPGMAEPDWSQWQDTDAAQNPSDLGTVDPRVDTGDENVKGDIIGKDKEKNADSEAGEES